MRPRMLALLLSPVLVLSGLLGPAAPSDAAEPAAQLANLDHLDWLGSQVTPPSTPRHTTYQLDTRPDIGVLWTYADSRPEGFVRVGGGAYDAAADTWAQGAFNSDDIARAAVAYLRYSGQHPADASATHRARELLRGLTWMQTDSGPNAGNFVLWMQPDGSLNPSPVIKELPDPSDSGQSYWLARAVWALGEGYAAFQTEDPAFAAFLHARLDLALAALERQVLVRFGRWNVADGVRVPSWLIVDGSDATAEAVLGLAAFSSATNASDPLHVRALTATKKFAEGIAAMGGGSPSQWPYGAILPWAQSQSDWHAWASQQPAALAAAAVATATPAFLMPAVADAASFTAKLLIDDGPDNGLLPSPSERAQIAYGVDSRLESLLAVADATGAQGLRDLAAVDAAWFFGANRAGRAMYDPATGVTFDGLEGDGRINPNSGAESAIHGVLAMLALDAAPEVKARALSMTSVLTRNGSVVVEGESAVAGAGASVVTPASAWTGESLFSSGAFLEMSLDSTATWTLPAASAGVERQVEAVLDLPVASRQTVRWRADGDWIGRTATRGIGAQGITGAPGALLPVTLPRTIEAGASTLGAVASVGTSKVDALLVSPVVSGLTLGSGGSSVLRLLRNSATDTRASVEVVPGGSGSVQVYDGAGELTSSYAVAGTATVPVLAGGFTTLTAR